MRAVVLYDRAFANIFARHNPGAHPVDDTHDVVQDGNDADPIARALEAGGAEVKVVALGDDPIAELSALCASKPGFVFNLCDSMRGRPELAHVVPGVLDAMGVPYAGASGEGFVVTKRKHDVKAILEREGIPTPRYQVIDKPWDVKSFALDLVPPVILKLTGEHASVGLDQASVCWDTREVHARALDLFSRFDQPILVEEYVAGREFYVSCVGEPLAPVAFMEQKFDHLPEGFLKARTFDAKWFDKPDLAGNAPVVEKDERWSYPIPQRRAATPWSRPLEDILPLAARTLTVCGARDWGRVDLRLDEGGVPLVIDVTPNTYLHPSSPCALAAKSKDIDYEDLIMDIVQGAMSRHVSLQGETGDRR